MELTVGRRALVWLVGALAGSVVLVSPATAESPERYPYDPACAWGRLADGHGMLIRCLEPAEASRLLEGPLPQKEPSKAQSGAKSESSAAPGSSEAKPPVAPAAANPVTGQVIVSNVGPATADTGELPLAAKKLGLPQDRYVDCVKKHGGLSAERARVVVRFLVRERGRAEGVSVKSHEGVSKAAASCIADVVDRRYVGYPAAPLVGATIPIELSAKR